MIDAWSGPTPTPQQFPHNEPNGIRKLLAKIDALELQIKEKTSNLLRTAGIYLTPAGMTIDSNLTLTGTLTANGVIDNAALKTPVSADVSTVMNGYSGDLIFGTNKVVATATLTKPTWATQCVCQAISVVSTNTTNQGTVPLGVSMRTVIAGTASGSVDASTMATDVYTTKVVPFNRGPFTTAGNVTIETQVTATGGAAGNALSAQLAVTVFWYA